MKIIRSSKCSLEFSTASKRQELKRVLSEYGRLCNIFIDLFWDDCPVKAELLAEIVNVPESWLSHRLRKTCAREAIDLIRSSKESIDAKREQLVHSIAVIEGRLEGLTPDTKKKRRLINDLHIKLKKKQMRHDMIQPRKPKHRGRTMSVSSTIADLQSTQDSSFDAWLHLSSIGDGIILDLPVNFHRHFKRLNDAGERLNSYVITPSSVQFAFEIETGLKREVQKIIGVDTGINALASLSTGEQLGTDIKAGIDRVKRCKRGSKGNTRAIRALRQRIDEVAKEVVGRTDLVVVEKLEKMGSCSKLRGRLSRSVRSDIGSWNWRHWLERIKMNCENDRVSFRSVSPFNTSVTCSTCGHVDVTSRNKEVFMCRSCGCTGNADINAAVNIVHRFVRGKYGSPFQHLNLDLHRLTPAGDSSRFK